MIKIISASEAYKKAIKNQKQVVTNVMLGIINDKILEAVSEGNTKIFHPCDVRELTTLGIVDYLIENGYSISFVFPNILNPVPNVVEGVTISCKPL